MEYMVATGYGPGELARVVNELIASGWVPFGGVAVEPAADGYAALYAQAMTKTKDELGQTVGEWLRG